jgi:AraC-like DNA-binding protein
MREYDPKGNGRTKSTELVQFVEAEPPQHLAGLVHRFLSLRTIEPLRSSYRFHALPDACVYLIFDQRDPAVTGVTRLASTSEVVDLGQEFHFTNVRLLPGVWRGEVAYGEINRPYAGPLPLVATNKRLAGLPFEAQQPFLVQLMEFLVEQDLVAPNPVFERIMDRFDDIRSVADMAVVACLSPRQLQRVVNDACGFSPHDLLKILRVQRALDGDRSSYADQSHFIRSFRQATGYTPSVHARRFDV